MKTLLIVVFTLLFVCGRSQELCNAKSASYYHTDVEDYTDILQELIDKASEADQHALLLKPGRFGLRGQDPIVLKPGVSMHGNKDEPTIFTTLVDRHSNESATIQVPASSIGWSVSGIIFDNVNIDIQPQQNAEVAKIENNIFLNGGRGSIKSSFGSNLLIDSNIFLRDHAHAGTVFIPKYDTTNAGIVFQTQENSIITNNIFGMDLRHMDDIIPHVSAELKSSFKKIKYALDCLKLKWDEQQGFLASAIQLYSTNEITIRANIMNATFPDTMPIAQDHAISVVGSNQTYVVQNFIAGWELADFGGAVRFTSAVDSYVVSNYLANTAVMMYVANHADFMQVDNLVVYNNFLYRFLDHNVDPPAPLDGWLYEGITFFDFWTARKNNTIRPPIWNSSVPISPHAHNIVITNNKFGAAQGIDPNVISMGNLDPAQAKVDKKNCYVTRPLIPTATNNRVPLLWRQSYRSDMSASFGGKIPTHFKHPKSRKLIQHVPEELRRLPVLDYWKAFTLRNATVPMISPEAPCFNMLQ